VRKCKLYPLEKIQWIYARYFVLLNAFSSHFLTIFCSANINWNFKQVSNIFLLKRAFEKRKLLQFFAPLDEQKWSFFFTFRRNLYELNKDFRWEKVHVVFFSFTSGSALNYFLKMKPEEGKFIMIFFLKIFL
jgi:hypothetical protein